MYLMDFNVNSPILFIIVGIIILLVLGQSIFFLVKALKEGKRIGMDKKVLKNTIKSSAIFSVAPAIAIFIGVITLTGLIGNALPWLRLSVIGSLTYETTAAKTAMEALGISTVVSAGEFVTIAIVMTVGIVPGLFLVPLLTKPINNGLVKIKKKNSAWGEIFMSSMFMGMISAFLGYIFCDVTKGLVGWIPVFVMLISAAMMLVMGAIIKVTKLKVLEDYAIPISMIVAMVCAIPLTNWIG